MLFELLCGRRPHQADTLGELLRSTHRDPPARLAKLRPDLPPAVVSAIEQLLAREPEQRPADLAEWASDLAALAAVVSRVLAPDVALRL
jgi:serine/threonine-protein kinase